MNDAPVGVFDSGLGGISVLKKLQTVLPNESFIYFGDSQNAPYGEKDDDEIFELSSNVFENLIDMGVKAVVIACNTATSVAAKRLRLKYKDMPILGMEPAVKPASIEHKDGTVVVMATNATLRRRKFHELMSQFDDMADIIPMPCPDIVEYVEKGETDSPELMDYLRSQFATLGDRKIDAIVLGCTHFPFVADRIREAAGGEVALYDGSDGTARELKRRLKKWGVPASEDHIQTVEILNSAGNRYVEISRKLLEM
ncbi:MAG: glutamate racemase [Clostridia bacterium]|nr:glutamate racemase [Clostridia bacterium]